MLPATQQQHHYFPKSSQVPLSRIARFVYQLGRDLRRKQRPHTGAVIGEHGAAGEIMTMEGKDGEGGKG